MTKAVLLIATLNCSFLFSQIKNDTVKTTNIENVTIEGKKKLIERKADRLVFNVEASVASQGMDAAETIANVPMMKVDENLGSISIVGKSNVSVMINGKILNLFGVALLNYLKNIRSENILKIEVITTPPAKYDAQGNSGLVNIILKKNPNIGFSGNLANNFIQRSYSGFSDNAALNYQSEKFSASFKLNYYDSAKRSDENYSILGTSQNFSKSVRKDMWWELTPSINLSYQIGKNSEIGLDYLFAHQKSGMNIANTTKNIDKNLFEENFLTDTYHRERNPMQILSAYYDLKLDSLGKKLSIAGNYYKNNSDTEVNFSTLKTSDQSVQNVFTKSLVTPKIFSAQADLELPYSFGTIETGLKFNQFKNTSDLKYFDIINDEDIQDYSRVNIFDYKENNYAAYFSFSKKINENWDTKAGIRYEETLVNAFSPLTNITNENRYGQWFPSAYIAYKKDKNAYSLSYSRRINRPSMSNLDPFRWYSNPLSYSSGNPELQPSYINNFELGYTYNNKFSASIYYLKLKNAFGQISYLNNQEIVGTYLNYYDNNFFGLNLSYTGKIVKWWETSLTLNASMQNSKVFNIEAETQSGTSLSYSVNNTFTLNQRKTIFFFLNYDQSLPYENVNSKFYNTSELTSGFKISLIEKQLQINATVTNIFAQRFRGDLFFKENTQHYNNYWDGRSFRLSVNYTFGNKKNKRTAKTINFEEKNRVQ